MFGCKLYMNDEIDIGLDVLLELDSEIFPIAAQLLEDFRNDVEKILIEERGDS